MQCTSTHTHIKHSRNDDLLHPRHRCTTLCTHSNKCVLPQYLIERIFLINKYLYVTKQDFFFLPLNMCFIQAVFPVFVWNVISFVFTCFLFLFVCACCYLFVARTCYGEQNAKAVLLWFQCKHNILTVILMLENNQ